MNHLLVAYNATNNESPIPPPRAPIAPPTVLPPSLVLPSSPLFDPRDIFLPEDILPPQKQAYFLSSSFTDSSAPPQERLKANNMIRVNQLVDVLLIESSIHLLDQNRYPVDTSLIHIESRKSPITVLFDVDAGRISIRHGEYLRVSL
ncbi:hypothetical protein Tco_1201922 [Tanacetum coccineum]